MDVGYKPGDRFVVERKLGIGSMGVVLLAHDNELGIPVALKHVGPCEDAALSEAKLWREGEALKRLDHPGIVQFLGTLKMNGQFVVVQEFVDGFTFRQWFNWLLKAPEDRPDFDSFLRGIPGEEGEEEITWLDVDPAADGDDPSDADARPAPLPVAARHSIESDEHIRRSCELVRQAAAALGHAHEKGVIHRDLKPENLMIDREGKVRIIDFGIARYLGAPTLSQSRAILGSPLYMSPEHITGRINVDARSDVFSLGIVLYESLTLRCPYSTYIPLALFQQIVTRPTPPVTWGNRRVPPDLEAVVHKAIAKDPQERHANGGAFEQDLRCFLAGKPVSARPYHYRPDRREIAAERPAGVTIAALLFFFLATISFLMILAILTSPTADRRDPTLAALAACGLIAFATGRGLLYAHRAALVLAPLVGAIGAMASLRFFIVSLTSEESSTFTTIMFFIIILFNVFILGNAFFKSSRRWARDAQLIRSQQMRPPEPGA